MRRPPSSRNRLLLEGLQGAGQGGRQAEACHPGQLACRLARTREACPVGTQHTRRAAAAGAGRCHLRSDCCVHGFLRHQGGPTHLKSIKASRMRTVEATRVRCAGSRCSSSGSRAGTSEASASAAVPAARAAQAARPPSQGVSRRPTGQGRAGWRGREGDCYARTSSTGPGGTVPTVACPAPTCRGRDQSAQHGQQRLNEGLRVAVGYRLAACTRSRTSRFRQVWRPWRARARTHVRTGLGRDADKRQVHHRQGEKGKNARRLPSPPALPACPAYSPAHP